MPDHRRIIVDDNVRNGYAGKMEKGSRSSSPVLEYEKPQVRARLFSPTFAKWLVGFVVLLAICIMMALVGAPELLIAYFVLAPMVMLATIFAYAIRAKRESRRTEAEEEAEWEERQRRQKEMLDIARQIYANGPVGCWRILYGYRHSLGGPTIQEKRVIEFQSDGKGIYRAIDALGMHVAVAFEFKAVEPQFLSVKLTAPMLGSWNRVEFGFAIETATGEPELMLWMMSENPMPEGARELWPFRGEFLREES
jgi:hypothetical protein